MTLPADAARRYIKLMKVMAIGTVQNITQDIAAQILPREVPHTLQLYLDGVIEQFWVRHGAGGSVGGVIFLMNVDSLDHARRTVDALPLTAAGHMTFELMHVGPLSPLGRLIKEHGPRPAS